MLEWDRFTKIFIMSTSTTDPKTASRYPEETFDSGSVRRWVDGFQQQGMVVIPPDQLLSDEQRRRLDNIVQQMDYVKVVGGDTGDKHSVWVGRFVNDVDKPQWLHSLTGEVLDILFSGPLKSLYCQLLSVEDLCVRRCQANRLEVGDFIGYHIDQDTTPDYEGTAIFQLSDGFEGGEFVLEHPEYGEQVVDLPRYSMLFNRGDIPHWVKPVRRGKRLSVACFLSTNFGQTQQARCDIKISQ